MGLHTGEPTVTEEGYVGLDVHRGARIAAAGHGGQVLLSEATARLVDVRRCVDLGEHRLKDLTAPQSPLPARRRALPAAEDALPDEPAAPGDAVPRA